MPGVKYDTMNIPESSTGQASEFGPRRFVQLERRGILLTLGVQSHLAGEVERVHRTFLGLSRLQIFELPARSGESVSSYAMLLRRGFPRMKGKNLSYHLDANRRLFLLLFPQLAADSGKGLS